MKGLPSCSESSKVCDACLQGKQHRNPFPPETQYRAEAILGLVHMDLCGPITPSSLGGHKYFMLFVDDFSRMVWGCICLRQSLKPFNLFEEWCCLVENQSNRKLKVIRSDNGKEFVNHTFNSFCKTKGIRRQFSTPYSPSTKWSCRKEKCNGYGDGKVNDRIC